MPSININFSSIREALAAKDFHDDIDYEAILNAWMGDVTTAITRTHGRRYSYVTPPASSRTRLRRREGRLLEGIRASKYVRPYNGYYTAGYDYVKLGKIAPYFDYHLNEDTTGKESFTILKPAQGKHIFIPLRAALNSDGTLAIDPPSNNTYSAPKTVRKRRQTSDDDVNKFVFKEGGYLWTNFYTAMEDGLCDFEGEDINKFHDKSVILIKGNTPYFIAATHIRIPKRLTINKELKEYYNKPSGYGSLQGRLDKEINKVLRKAARSRR